MNELTEILSALDAGDAAAADRLLPLVYDELRKLAAARLAQETPGQTLQATALVHEAYLRLTGGALGDAEDASAARWDSRGHFFAAAAEAMRRILVDAARRKRRLKRGGGLARENWDLAELAADDSAERNEDLLAVNEALDKLAAVDPQAAELVKLRYFVGLTISEAARTLKISPRTADRLWAYARAWLHQAVRGQ